MPRSSVTTVTLQPAETERIRSAFGENSANLDAVKSFVQDAVLPKIQAALGWTAIRATKGRVNDWRTVELKYNSLFHRDRHIYGDAPASRRHAAAWLNLSAVVYLDAQSCLEFLDGSEEVLAPRQSTTTPTSFVVGAGTIVVFPSCLIHRAAASRASKRRRTIVLFDLEDPSEPSPLPHDIVLCPGWTQKPLLHSVSSEDEVEGRMLHNLLANRSPCGDQTRDFRCCGCTVAAAAATFRCCGCMVAAAVADDVRSITRLTTCARFPGRISGATAAAPTCDVSTGK